MATTTPTTVLAPPPQESADRDALMKHHSIRGLQYASIAAPSLFIVASLVRRRPLSANSVLASTWVGGILGAAGGAGAGFVQYKDVDSGKLSEARAKIAYDVRQIRLDDYSTIGAILGAVLTPAVFYRRTRLVHSVLGGAGLGVAGGSVTHSYKSFQEGQEFKKKLYDAAPKQPS